MGYLVGQEIKRKRITGRVVEVVMCRYTLLFGSLPALPQCAWVHEAILNSILFCFSPPPVQCISCAIGEKQLKTINYNFSHIAHFLSLIGGCFFMCSVIPSLKFSRLSFSNYLLSFLIFLYFYCLHVNERNAFCPLISNTLCSSIHGTHNNDYYTDQWSFIQCRTRLSFNTSFICSWSCLWSETGCSSSYLSVYSTNCVRLSCHK